MFDDWPKFLENGIVSSSYKGICLGIEVQKPFLFIKEVEIVGEPYSQLQYILLHCIQYSIKYPLIVGRTCAIEYTYMHLNAHFCKIGKTLLHIGANVPV